MGSPSGPRTGRHGFMNGVPFMRYWSLNWSQALETRYHSASYSGPERTPGIEDWNGVVEGYGGKPGIFPGESIALKLFSGPSDGVHGNTGKVYAATAIADSLTINWQWQPSQMLGYALNFSANGCMGSEENDYYDTTDTCHANMCNMWVEIASVCDIEVDTGTGTGTTSLPVYTEVQNLESASLSITADNGVIVNSSTNCCTQREHGNVDWTITLTDQEQYPLFNFNEYYAFKMYIAPGVYWDVQYGELQDITDIRIDRETNDIVSKTNVFAGSGRICCGDDAGDGATIGQIVDPDSATKWPVTA